MTGDLRRVAGALQAFDRVAQAAPRVSVLAGSVEAGHITYVARSKLVRFPDYVSVKQDGADLVILSRLRFGFGDAAVNRRRLDAWLERL